MQDYILKYRPNVKKEYEENKKDYDNTLIYTMNLVKIAKMAGQVINNCENGHIYFVGRSLEILYDTLMSLFNNLPEWQDKIAVLPLSMKDYIDDHAALVGLAEHLERHKMDPKSIIGRSRKTILVDVVYAGRTFHNLYDLYREWAQQEGIDPESLFLKLKIIAFVSDITKKDEMEHIENNIASGIVDLEDNETKKIKSKAYHKIFIDEAFWRDFADKNDKYKLTNSFDESVMSWYAYDIFDVFNDLPEDELKGGEGSVTCNATIYGVFQRDYYRQMVINEMRKGPYHTPELKHESEDMAWHRNIMSRINKKTPSKTHDNHNPFGQVNFKGPKNKRKSQKKDIRKQITDKEQRQLKDIENKVDKIVNQVHNAKEGYLSFKMAELPPQVRNRIVENNMFILKRDDDLTIYDSEKFELEDLAATYDYSFMGIFPHKNQVNPDYKSKKFAKKEMELITYFNGTEKLLFKK
jgi:hypothetical protein